MILLPEDLQRDGDGCYCQESIGQLTTLHDANIVCAQLLDSGTLVTGSVDRTLKTFQIDGLPDVAGKSDSKLGCKLRGCH